MKKNGFPNSMTFNHGLTQVFIMLMQMQGAFNATGKGQGEAGEQEEKTCKPKQE